MCVYRESKCTKCGHKANIFIWNPCDGARYEDNDCTKNWLECPKVPAMKIPDIHPPMRCPECTDDTRAAEEKSYEGLGLYEDPPTFETSSGSFSELTNTLLNSALSSSVFDRGSVPISGMITFPTGAGTDPTLSRLAEVYHASQDHVEDMSVDPPWALPPPSMVAAAGQYQYAGPYQQQAPYPAAVSSSLDCSSAAYYQNQAHPQSYSQFPSHDCHQGNAAYSSQNSVSSFNQANASNYNQGAADEYYYNRQDVAAYPSQATPAYDVPVTMADRGQDPEGSWWDQISGHVLWRNEAGVLLYKTAEGAWYPA